MTQHIRQYPDELREQAETDMLTIHPPIPCPACRRADQAGLALAELHLGCVEQQPTSDPAHDAGPDVAECAAADRNWDLERHGE